VQQDKRERDPGLTDPARTPAETESEADAPRRPARTATTADETPNTSGAAARQPLATPPPPRGLTIAIDGPAASGKSTIARAVAERLGLLYLDTGTMYRAVTWLALQHDVAPLDEDAVSRLAETAAFGFPSKGAADRVNPPILINGVDATAGLREPTVDAAVSGVSAFPRVRRALVREQRRLAQNQGVVMVGRDIGTVVLPDAPLKIYLEADAAERARRRYEERRAHGERADYMEILEAMEQRDRLDAQRADSPLRPAGDAVRLDTTGQSIGQVVERALALTRDRMRDQDGAEAAGTGGAEAAGTGGAEAAGTGGAEAAS